MGHLLQVARAHADAVGELLRIYEGLGRSISLLRQGWELCPKDAVLEAVAVGIYKDILEFHRRALEYFRKPSKTLPSCILRPCHYGAHIGHLVWKVVFASTWTTYKVTFEDLIAGIGQHNLLILGNTTFAEYRQRRQLEEVRKAAKRCEKDQEHFLDLQQWLRGPSIADDHARLRRCQVDGTGRWLFKHPEFKKWFDPVSPYVPLLLWLNGKPGAGKSTLAAMAVQEAIDNAEKQVPKPTVLYFYCKGGDSERDNFVAIGRSLLLQLLRNGRPRDHGQQYDRSVLEHLYSAFLNTPGPVLETRSVVEELLETAILNCACVYIVLDGIDECQAGERQGIVRWFSQLVENLPQDCADQVRVLFVSQDDMRARRDFAGMSGLRIDVDDTRGDIAKSCEDWAVTMPKERGRPVKLPDETRRLMITRITESSNGEMHAF